MPAASTKNATACWLMKSEPDVYPWEQLVAERKTRWDGVRSFEARNNLRAMKEGDVALFYHSNVGKEIVGVMKVVRAAYPDPTAPGEDWSVVDVAPVRALAKSVPLAAIKKDATLKDMALVRRSRLSVVPVTPAELARILALGETQLPSSARTKLPRRPAATRVRPARRTTSAPRGTSRGAPARRR